MLIKICKNPDNLVLQTRPNTYKPLYHKTNFGPDHTRGISEFKILLLDVT